MRAILSANYFCGFCPKCKNAPAIQNSGSLKFLQQLVDRSTSLQQNLQWQWLSQAYSLLYICIFWTNYISCTVANFFTTPACNLIAQKTSWMMPVCTVCVSYTADVTRPTQSAMQVAWTDNILYINHEPHTEVMNAEITPTTTSSGQLVFARDRGKQ